MWSRFSDKLCAQPWGARSLVALCVALFSGAVVALQYKPATPFYSVVGLDLTVPFGAFWRALHFYSSQFFCLFALLHLLAIVLTLRRRPTIKGWLRLNLALPVMFLLLFTGYILRGDATGEAAGYIAENIALSIPLVGRALNALLFAVDGAGLQRIYANHLFGLAFLWLLLCWEHLRRYQVTLSRHGWLLLTMGVVSLLWRAPMEPQRLGMEHINGPWFFLGLQELLRYLQPFWAGVVWPMVLLAAVIGLKGDRLRRYALPVVCCWLLLYAGLSVVGWSRGL